MFHPIDPAKLGPEELYEYKHLLRRVRSFINPAARRAFKIAEEGWVGQPLAEVVENQVLHDLFARLSVKGTAQSAEIPVDGRTFYANLAPIPGVGKVLAMQDITYLTSLSGLDQPGGQRFEVHSQRRDSDYSGSGGERLSDCIR